EGGPEVLVELTRLEPPVRQVRLLGRTSPAARPLGGVAGIGLVEVELAKQIVELRERRDETERTTQLAADGVALEVPRHVLAHLAQRAVLATEVGGHELRVPGDTLRDLAQARPDPLARTGEGRSEVGEQPRSPLAAAPDDDAVAPRLLDHRERVLGGPDVAVAEDGNVGHRLLEPGDRLPAGLARVVVRRGARVQG